MRFIVYQCSLDKDYFVVTDDAHESELKADLCPSGGKLERIGEYPEMGNERVAFDENLAKNSIENQGFYLFEAPSFAPVPPAPEMPG